MLRRTIARVIGAFGKDCRGQLAITFALATTPLIFLVGAAMDYSGASELKVRLQNATDGASLQLCQISGSPTQSDLERAALKYMTTYMGSAPFNVTNITPSTNPRQVTISTSANYSTSIVFALNTSFRTVPVSANAKCFGEPQTFEIALVLDNTGSMSATSGGQSKIQALRTAATNFVDFVYGNAAMSGGTKISLVPFATSVALPSSLKAASWVDMAGSSSFHWKNVAGSKANAAAAGFTNLYAVFTKLKAANASWDWSGCFESLPYPLNVQDVTPSASNPDSYYVPMLAADEAGAGGESYHTETSSGATQVYVNSYVTDSTAQSGCTSATQPTSDNARTVRACKYNTPTNATSGAYTLSGFLLGQTGPNFACGARPMTRLTNAQSTLDGEIAQMQPAGTTNIHEGFMWGWRSISPNSVLADGASYTKPFNTKIIVLMTDGMNTWGANPYNSTLKSLYSAYGYFANADGSNPNGRIPAVNANPLNDTQARAAMDALTLAACGNARAGPNNVVIYTVGFSVASDPIDQQGIDMLRSCAGSSDRAFIANDSTALIDVFRKIAQDIGNLKLTN